MRKKLIWIMGAVLLLGVLLMGKSRSMDTTSNASQEPVIVPCKFEFDGHRYIIFRGDARQIIHDPNCSCGQRSPIGIPTMGEVMNAAANIAADDINNLKQP